MHTRVHTCPASNSSTLCVVAKALYVERKKDAGVGQVIITEGCEECLYQTFPESLPGYSWSYNVSNWLIVWPGASGHPLPERAKEKERTILKHALK